MEFTREQLLEIMEHQVPFNRFLGLRAEAELVRKGNRVCHVRVSVSQGGALVAEGRAVFNIHRRRTEDA